MSNIVSRVNASDGDTATPGAGADRILVYMFRASDSDAALLTAEIAGVSATILGQISRDTAGGRTVAAVYIKESDIPGGDVSVGPFTWDGDAPLGISGVLYTVEDVNQTTPFIDVNTIDFIGEDGAHPAGPLEVASGGSAMGIINVTSGVTITAPDGWTSDRSNFSGAGVSYLASVETTDSETITPTFTFEGFDNRSGVVLFAATQSSSTETPGIPATVLENADGSLALDTAVTRTITLVSDGTELFTGSQTTDSETGELPEIDLSETDAEVDDVVDDKIVIDGATAPALKSQTFRITVADLAEE